MWSRRTVRGPRSNVRMAGHRHDFDFIFSSWHVHNRKLRDVADPDCRDRVEFDATRGLTGEAASFQRESAVTRWH
jgi:hypothetical protein